MSGPIATAVSAIFGFEASVASFIASIVTGTISGGIQVGLVWFVSLASFLPSLDPPELLHAAAQQRAALCRRGQDCQAAHLTPCKRTSSPPSGEMCQTPNFLLILESFLKQNPSKMQHCSCCIFFFTIAVWLPCINQLFGCSCRDQGPRPQHLLPRQKGSDRNVWYWQFICCSRDRDRVVLNMTTLNIPSMRGATLLTTVGGS